MFYVNNPESFSTEYVIQEIRYAVEFSLSAEQKIAYQNEALKKLNLNPSEKDILKWMGQLSNNSEHSEVY